MSDIKDQETRSKYVFRVGQRVQCRDTGWVGTVSYVLISGSLAHYLVKWDNFTKNNPYYYYESELLKL